MRVVRAQWPAGQDCFATGMIETQGDPILDVYQRGARNVRNLEPIVPACAQHVRRFDALFVSQLVGHHGDRLDTPLARLDAR